MGIINKKNPRPDVRVLTLKRWNFPQTTQLFSEKGGANIHEDDFISYNSHHFITVKKCEIEDNTHPILCAHRRLDELRKLQREEGETDVHLVQSLVLLGEECDFWNTISNVLYISFIQLTNTDDLKIDEIRTAIQAIINRCAPTASWALYHSLDFCDLVLFSKNISYHDCNKILWELAVVRGSALAMVRDTFTISGFHRSFLKSSFNKLEKGEPIGWEDQASLSIQLSIQSYSTLKNMEEELKKHSISYKLLRTFGRYDVRIVTNELSGVQILRVLHLVDTLVSKSADTAFGGYKISMETSLNDIPQSEPADATQDRAFEYAAGRTMEQLCKECCKKHQDSADYADETMRSLKSLLKNGFAEEFVISVLLSFLSFLQITIEAQKYSANNDLPEEQQQRLKDSLGRMSRNYFNSLNTLALCTMHSERQFVQAPAFNASYFDVPPKMLAFYSAISQEVVNTLKADNDMDYRFLFVPNYQNDINVRPLAVDINTNLSSRLVIVHLYEEYFYDPVFAIKLFCHEAGHYIGERHREERAKYIFSAISFALLINTPVASIIKEPLSGSIADILASSLAEFMIKKFKEETAGDQQMAQFYLRDVAEFLSLYGYGINFFKDTTDRDAILLEWRKALQKNVKNEKAFRNAFLTGLKSIQRPLHSTYLTNIFKSDDDNCYVYDVFTRIVAHYATFPNDTAPSNDFICINENIIQAFSEAYADLRMSELIGTEYSWKDYETLLRKIEGPSFFQKILRHDTVLDVVFPGKRWTPYIKKKQKTQMRKFVILRYLTLQTRLNGI